ncbi:MAG: YaaL family protein [Lactobacillus sp.]|nr:YaaL family protein [Lactobacillus sp.]
MSLLNRDRVKKLGDQELINIISKLQNQQANQKMFDQTTIDLSDDNRIANRILQAKYNFLYEEARRRNTKSSILDSVVTQ